MPYKSSLYFLYDNEKSTDYKILSCNVQSGLLEEEFLYPREIKTVKIRGRDKPYFLEKIPQPLTLTVTLVFDENFTVDDLRNLARLLDKDYYAPLQFSEDLNKVYYAMLSDDSNLTHNAINQGYVTLQFVTNSPYTYSQIYQSNVYDFSNNSLEGSLIEIINNGDIDCKPVIYIEKVGQGDFSIVNESYGGKEMKFENITDQEILEIDSELKDIKSDIPEIYRYDNHVGDKWFLIFARGVNRLRVFGNCKIVFRYQFARLY